MARCHRLRYLAATLDKVADYNSSVCTWHISRELIWSYVRAFALPITWDYTELAVDNPVGGAYAAQLEWVSRDISHGLAAAYDSPEPVVPNASVISSGWTEEFDVILTDPPYYDAIPYSDLMDFFYIWLRRLLGRLPAYSGLLGHPLSPKWDHESDDGELIDDASRFEGNKERSKTNYEDGMFRAFMCAFAHFGQRDAWLWFLRTSTRTCGRLWYQRSSAWLGLLSMAVGPSRPK